MGVLWVAEHRTLGAEVVVKFLNDELADDPAAARRIAREAAAGARVRSTHVVQILDHGVSEGSPFIVMELLRGSDLRALLEARGVLSVRETATIVQQLARALARTHAEGIVHRDVKPSNIFLADGEGDIFVKLLDFGLARSVRPEDSWSTGSQPCAGTPLYMSPEQLTGGPVDARSDVWSLGALVFECLTGRRPFAGETLGAIALAVHTLAMPRPSDFKPELPAAIDGWFARACARRPEDRFPTATEASEALALGVGLFSPRIDPAQGGGAGVDRTITDVGRPSSAGGRSGPHTDGGASRLWIPVLAGAVMVVATVTGIHLARSQANAPSAVRGSSDGPSQAGARVDPTPRAIEDPPRPRAPSALVAEQAAAVRRPLDPRPHASARVPQATSSSAALRAADAGVSAPPPHGLYELPDERH